MKKTAVDAAANDYWKNYFKEYGEMWVRDIPRRIKTAVRRELKASKVEGRIVPIAKDISSANVLSLEAAFVGKLDDKDSRALITAEFSPAGGEAVHLGVLPPGFVQMNQHFDASLGVGMGCRILFHVESPVKRQEG